MKKTFLFSLLCLFAFTLKAQELTFEQTVKYIKDKMGCCERYSSKIEIKRNGLIILTYKDGREVNFNLFALYKHETQWDLSKEDYEYGFGYSKLSNDIFFLLSSNSIANIGFTTEEDNIRLIKAFRRLLILCTKEKDPFDN